MCCYCYYYKMRIYDLVEIVGDIGVKGAKADTQSAQDRPWGGGGYPYYPPWGGYRPPTKTKSKKKKKLRLRERLQ